MIAISESLIRSVRRLSVDDERESNAVEHLLSSSPTRGDQFSQDPHATGGAKKAAGAGQMQRGQSSRNIQEEDERDDHEAAAAPQPAPQPAVSSTHVVRFDPTAGDDKSKQRAAEPTFAKEPVEKKVTLSSSLSRELISSGNLRAARVGPMDRAGPATGPTLVLQVFTEVSKPPMKVKIVGAMTVEEVIELIIRQHEEQKRKPALAHRTPDRYDLRMVDEDDGTPDLDMPPLDRNGRIHKFEVEAVALVERAEPAAPKRGAAFSPPTSPTNRGAPGHGAKPSQGFGFGAEDPPITVRPQRGMSLEINQGAKPGRFFLKIHMPNHVSHVIPVAPEQTLEDVLPLIAKKRSVQAQNERVSQEILPQHFKFVYLGEKDALDMRLNLSELKSDELMLLPRVGADEDLKPISEVNGNGMSNLANNLLTREIADMYTEYKVIKTNQRGKRQERIMGIDGEKIYNKSIEASSDSVHRAFIRIPDVLSCEQLPDLPRSFRIVFRDKNSIEVREYEADTKMEAAQIVAKINYLKNL